MVMDFIGTWRTRGGEIATIKAQSDEYLWGEMPEEPHPDGGVSQLCPVWRVDGRYLSEGEDHPLDLMERISERYGQEVA